MSRTADPTARISLLRAARAVFAEKGIERAKLEDITRAAGLSKGAFYLHFESKDEVFKLLVELFLAQCQDSLESPPKDRGQCPSASMLLAKRLDGEQRQFELLWQNRSVVGMLHGSCQGELRYLFESFHGTILSKCVEWVEYLKANRFYRPEVNVQLAATLLSGAYNELAYSFIAADPKPSIAMWLRETQDAFVRAFGTPSLVAAAEALHRAAAKGGTALHATATAGPPAGRASGRAATRIEAKSSAARELAEPQSITHRLRTGVPKRRAATRKL